MTTQIPDCIKYNGKNFYTATYPPIFDIKGRKIRIPNERIVVAEYTEDNPDISSTACWRKYIAYWEIKDHKIYLLKTKGRYKLLDDDPLFADWVNGTIRLSYGKTYVFPFDTIVIYEKELQLTLEHGVVIGKKIENAEEVEQSTLDYLQLLLEVHEDEYECIVDEI
jgi:hypothetical protein